jgi:hypothetical protein
MLSLLDGIPSPCRLGKSLPPKNPLLIAAGGDLDEGLIIEFALPLLELFLLFPFRSLARWKFMRLLTAGDWPTQPPPGLAAGIAPKGVFALFTWGVVRIESSISSASIKSSSSELLPDESEPNIFTLPKELETVIRSAFAMVDHKDAEFWFINSALLE